MDTIEITWKASVTRLDRVGESNDVDLDHGGFYCILGGRWEQAQQHWTNISLLYIGQTYNQTLRQRLSQAHPAYQCIANWLKLRDGFAALVMIGVVTRYSPADLTQALVDDAECCLIFHNQPPCNVNCKQSYNGRDILVDNKGGFSPLNPSSHCR